MQVRPIDARITVIPLAVEKRQELLSVAEEMDDIWWAFISGNYPNVLPISLCCRWRDQILRALDSGKSQAISGNVWE